MLHTLQALVAPAVTERLTLLTNHLLQAEPEAQRRLHGHVGKSLRLELEGWPALLPPPPPLSWRVTPAGLLESCGPAAADPVELRVSVRLAGPLQLAGELLAGRQPPVEVSGDAQFAGEVDWLVQNLRWDMAGDLERLLPPPAAALALQAARTLGGGLRAAVQLLQGLAARGSGRGGDRSAA